LKKIAFLLSWLRFFLLAVLAAFFVLQFLLRPLLALFAQPLLGHGCHHRPAPLFIGPSPKSFLEEVNVAILHSFPRGNMLEIERALIQFNWRRSFFKNPAP